MASILCSLFSVILPYQYRNLFSWGGGAILLLFCFCFCWLVLLVSLFVRVSCIFLCCAINFLYRHSFWGISAPIYCTTLLLSHVSCCLTCKTLVSWSQEMFMTYSSAGLPVHWRHGNPCLISTRHRYSNHDHLQASDLNLTGKSC